MAKNPKSIREYVLNHIDRKTPRELADELGVKERKIKKILETEKRQAGRRRHVLGSSSGSLVSYGRFSLIGLAVLAVWGVLIYVNSFRVPFLFDDLTSIVENPLIRNFDRLGWYWRESPTKLMAYITYVFNYRLAGLNVAGYHLFNLLAHIGSAILVFYFVSGLFRTPEFLSEARGGSGLSEPKNQFAFALACAFLFVSHPVQTQAVTYIVQRNASLATFFYLATLTCYARYRLTGNRGLYFLSWVTCLLAMFTKQIAYTAPLALLLYEVCFYWGVPSASERRKGLTALAPYLIVLLFTYFSVYHGLVAKAGFAAQTQETGLISRGVYLLTQFSVICTYLRLLFFPINQNLDYDYPLNHHFFGWPVFPSFLVLALVFSAGVYLFMKKKRVPAFGIFWFFLALSIESSVIPISDVIFEHRLYLPMLGFTLVFCWGMWEIFRGHPERFRALFIMLILLLGFMTYQRNAVWGSAVGFWEDVVRKSPKKARPYQNLALAYKEQGNFQKALENYQKSLDIQMTRGADDQESIATGQNNLGNLYEKMGQNDKALALYLEAADHFVTAEVLRNIGRLYAKKQEYAKAEEYLNRAIEKKLDFAKAHNDLGSLYSATGKLDQAVQSFRRAADIDPTYMLAYRNLGVTYGKLGQHAEAIASLRRALELDPQNAEARYNLGIAYAKTERYDLARQELAELMSQGAAQEAARLKAILPAGDES